MQRLAECERAYEEALQIRRQLAEANPLAFGLELSPMHKDSQNVRAVGISGERHGIRVRVVLVPRI